MELLKLHVSFCTPSEHERTAYFTASASQPIILQNGGRDNEATTTTLVAVTVARDRAVKLNHQRCHVSHRFFDSTILSTNLSLPKKKVSVVRSSDGRIGINLEILSHLAESLNHLLVMQVNGTAATEISLSS